VHAGDRQRGAQGPDRDGRQTSPRLDLLVNSAGITRFVPHGDLAGLDDALISRILDVNVRGVIASVRAALPLMRCGAGGAIINISSIAAVTAMGSNIVNCASKAAVEQSDKIARARDPGRFALARPRRHRVRAQAGSKLA
jgi:3-oxoacyl-[acyl-carrier protein] reductase